METENPQPPPPEPPPDNRHTDELIKIFYQRLDALGTDLLTRHPEKMLAIKKLEMRLKYPKLFRTFQGSAEIFSRSADQVDWQVPADLPPHLSENLHLLRTLEPLHLESVTSGIPLPDSPVTRQFRALEILDYCHSPAKMASRTGISEVDIEIISSQTRQAASAACADLISTAYAARPSGKDHVDPDSFSRPFVIFITQEDITRLHPESPVTGLAYADARAAIVGVNPLTDITHVPTSIGTRVEANTGKLTLTSLHELGHLLRLVQKDRRHYRDPDIQPRHSRNLEEGSDELFTQFASRYLSTDIYASFPRPQSYREAASRIRTGLIPLLVDAIVSTPTGVEDLQLPLQSEPLPNTSGYLPPQPEQLHRLIGARFILGDYELLLRGAQHHHENRNLSTSVTQSLRRNRNIFNDMGYLLEDPRVFGHERRIHNDFHSVDPDPDTGDYKLVDIYRGSFLPLPLSGLNRGRNCDYLQSYQYEYYDTAADTWKQVPYDQIPAQTNMRMRVNYLDVQGDFANRPSSK